MSELNAMISAAVWGLPMLILMVGTGVYLSFRTGGVQFSRFGYAMRNTIGKVLEGGKAAEGTVTPLQAVTTALGATVGTGNIAGIATAISLGGPGTVFWLWVTALIGMCTKYVEVLLSVHYRERNAKGEPVGGPMYYIKNGLGEKWRVAATAFALMGMLSGLGTGNGIQAMTISAVTEELVYSFTRRHYVHIELIVGVLIALCTAAVLLGGVSRIGKVTQAMVPTVGFVYVVACMTVIVLNAEKLVPTLFLIVESALEPSVAVGGAVGITVRSSVMWGVRRGVFSNEAGLGSAPIAHAATSEKDPVKQGMYGIFEVFADTIVICSLTAFTILMSGVDIDYGRQGGVALNAQAFGTVFGETVGSAVLAFCIAFFALSTILSWGLYGARCFEYLFGLRFSWLYKLLFVCMSVPSAMMEEGFAWELADTINGLMALPNLLALLCLAGVASKLTKGHFGRK